MKFEYLTPYFILFLMAVIFLYIGVFIIPMKLLENTSQERFCIHNGFDYIGSNSKYISYQEGTYHVNKISSKPVACKWGFYKVSNCQWVFEPEIVEVGK